MPVYEYLCKDCGHKFDKMRSMSQADLVAECTQCHSTSPRRLLSRFFASSEGRSITNKSNSCSGCGGGSCGSCASGSH